MANKEAAPNVEGMDLAALRALIEKATAELEKKKTETKAAVIKQIVDIATENELLGDSDLAAGLELPVSGPTSSGKTRKPQPTAEKDNPVFISDGDNEYHLKQKGRVPEWLKTCLGDIGDDKQFIATYGREKVWKDDKFTAACTDKLKKLREQIK